MEHEQQEAMEHNYLKDQEIEHMQQSIIDHQDNIKKA